MPRRPEPQCRRDHGLGTAQPVYHRDRAVRVKRLTVVVRPRHRDLIEQRTADTAVLLITDDDVRRIGVGVKHFENSARIRPDLVLARNTYPISGITTETDFSGLPTATARHCLHDIGEILCACARVLERLVVGGDTLPIVCY